MKKQEDEARKAEAAEVARKAVEEARKAAADAAKKAEEEAKKVAETEKAMEEEIMLEGKLDRCDVEFAATGQRSKSCDSAHK